MIPMRGQMPPIQPNSGVFRSNLMNFRSLAEYESCAGGSVRPDHIYRGGAPSSLGDVGHLDIPLAADLRHPDERGAGGADGKLPAASFKLITLNPRSSGEAPHLSLMNGIQLDENSINLYYLNLYRSLALSPAYSDLFGRFLKAVADGTGKIMIFCAAGKDRTGILTAILGRILGLAEDDIFTDYLASNDESSLQHLAPLVFENAYRASGQSLTDELIRKVLGVSPAYLDAAFGEIESRFGRLDGYLDAIGVRAIDREGIRRRLLTN